MRHYCSKCGKKCDEIGCDCQSLLADKEQPDYYMEGGRMVFTAAFLLKRGYCCKSGCRHCPYGFKKQLH